MMQETNSFQDVDSKSRELAVSTMSLNSKMNC
jgi:hypothetical protein